MNLVKLGLALGLVGISWSPSARAAPSDEAPSATQPPPQAQPPLPLPGTAPATTSTPATPAASEPIATSPGVDLPPEATGVPAPSAGTSPQPSPVPPQPVTAPAPRQPATKVTAPAPAVPRPPQDVTVSSSTADSQAYGTSAANSQMAGNPQAALSYADRAIAADPRDPWAHYDKAMALARLGDVDDALKYFKASEERFNLADTWGRSVAIYGGAHALSVASRCEEARREFQRYAAFVRGRDPRSADMAMRYAAGCREKQTVEPSETSTIPSP